MNGLTSTLITVWRFCLRIAVSRKNNLALTPKCVFYERLKNCMKTRSDI